jgi:hypothetical protein
MSDDAELIPNHNEAWLLAIHKRGISNIARAYIELRELAARFSNGTHTRQDREKLHNISHANDL